MNKKLLLIFLIIFIFSGEIFGQTTTLDNSEDNIKEVLEEIGFTAIIDNRNYIDFTLKDIYGNESSLRNMEGKIIMLNFWATWCPPCRKEMPSMEILHKKMEGRNFEMVTVNIGEKTEVAKEFMEKNNYTFKAFTDLDGAVAGKYQIRFIPTTYVIDTKGKIAGIFTSAREWDSDDVIEAFTKITE